MLRRLFTITQNTKSSFKDSEILQVNSNFGEELYRKYFYNITKKADLLRYITSNVNSSRCFTKLNELYNQIMSSETKNIGETLLSDFSTEPVDINVSQELWGNMMDHVQEKKKIAVSIDGFVSYLGEFCYGILMYKNNAPINVFADYISFSKEHDLIRMAAGSLQNSAYITKMDEIVSIVLYNLYTNRSFTEYQYVCALTAAGAVLYMYENKIIAAVPNSKGDRVICKLHIDTNNKEITFQPLSTDMLPFAVTAQSNLHSVISEDSIPLTEIWNNDLVTIRLCMDTLHDDIDAFRKEFFFTSNK